MIDIDCFKNYNDHYGHPAGDEVLISISKVLSITLRRATDLMFRIGGEEFAAIIVGPLPDDLGIFSQKIHQSIKQMNTPHENSSASSLLTVSMGISKLNALRQHSFNDLYQAADKALYHAKNSGRNQTATY